jgi:hypothetical protein
LGAGIYFWEYGVDRALEFAKLQKKRGRIRKPAVVGAIVQRGACFDLMDTRYTTELGEAYELFKKLTRRAGAPLPLNEGKTPDRKLRHRDCAVLNFYLEALDEKGLRFDTVRCAFLEGRRAFAGSGIWQQSHIQIAVRNPACVVGVFRPMMVET